MTSTEMEDAEHYKRFSSMLMEKQQSSGVLIGGLHTITSISRILGNDACRQLW